MRSIDVHAHLTPQCFWRATDNGGDWHTLRRETDARGMEYALVGGRRQALPPRSKWTPEERLADMDSLGVDVHVVSPYVGFYNYHLPVEVARATSAATNDEIAGMIRAWPDRFAGLGTLPMQDVEAAVTEMEQRIRRAHGLSAQGAFKAAVREYVGVAARGNPLIEWSNRGTPFSDPTVGFIGRPANSTEAPVSSEP